MSEVMNTNKILRRISYPRVNSEPMNNDVQMSWPTKDAPPIDQNRVFKMSYNSRDFRNSDVSAGSINVMSSLKEKLAEKSASGSFSGCAKKTPSRVHAMLNDQLGTVDDEPEMRFHSEQTKTVPSKVFQALQHSYPGVDGTQRMPPRSELYEHYTPAAEVDYDYGHFQSNQTTAVPSKVFQALQHSYPGNEAQRISRQTGYHPMRPSEIEYDEGDIHERFVGNPTNKVPSKVFQALQHNYGTDAAPDISRYQNTDTRTVNERNTNQIPSKSFQMLHQQYSDEKDFKPSAAISGDLQDALDLLEQELDAMTTGKGQSSTNPLITVPLPKGVNRHERVSQDLAPSSSIENQKIQVPLYRGVPNTGYQAQNYQQMNQDDVTAPPVPVRVDSKKFQHPVRGQQPNEVVYEAPVARQLTSPRALSNRKNFNENEVMVAPIANVEKVVAYSAELETPWINPNKDDQRKGNRSLIIKPKSSSRSSGHYIKDGRTDSIDSTGSYSSIQERIPDFDPETYIVTTKPPSVSSRGLRSDSSDSGQSFSSYSSNLEPRHDEETYKGVSKTDGNKSNEPFQEVNKPRKMVINVNGKAKITKSENNEDDARQMIKYRDDGSMNTGEVRELGGHGSGGHRHDLKIEESERVPSPLANLQEMMDMIQNDDVFTDDMKMQNKEYERKEVESQDKRVKEIESRVQKTETSKLKDLKLEQLNSEEINEVFLQNDEQPMMFEKFSSPVQSRIQVKSVARKSNQSEGDQQKSPPVNIQMSRNSHRRSIQLDQSNQIDKVGSFNGDDDGDYYPYEQYNDKRTSTNTTYYDGPQMDENSNEYGPTKYQRGTPSTYDKKNKEKLMTRTEAKPIRLTNNQPFIESPNRQISATSSGIRITLPAFSVKVSANNGSPDHAQPQR